MKLTIAIPTHNRAASLRETLRSLASLKLPDALEAECLVVDNNSDDDTAEVVAAIPALPHLPIKMVAEPRIGSSFARNRAIDDAASDFIFFIDDDVVVEPGWARELLSEMERRRLDVACGMVLPRWPGPLPRWLRPELYSKLAVHDPDPSVPLAARETIAGYFSANVGFRRDTFSRFGRFRTDLGVVGQNPISGEDTELFARVIAGGGTVGFAQRAVVHHLIGPERLTRQYFRRKSFAYGVGTALKGGASHNRLDKLLKNLVRMAAAAASGNSSQAFYHQLECVNFFGYWRGRLQLILAARR